MSLMFNRLIWLFFIAPFGVYAQPKGVVFSHEDSWQAVLSTAYKAKKFILVDCYATWCGPCKLMDKYVYDDDSVGSYVNAHFISVKLQMDSTDEDDTAVRNLYGLAYDFARQYHVYEYPSFLFFSPDGQLVHRESGGKSISSFLALAKAVLDPKQQYYSLLANYKTGEKDYGLMPALITAARKMREDSLAKRVFREYLNNYLNKLPESLLLTKENISFLSINDVFLFPTDKVFQTYYNRRIFVDSVIHYKGFADYDINLVIYHNFLLQNIDTCIKKDERPHWNRLEKIVANKFDENLAKRNVLRAKSYYYKVIREWKTYCKYYIEEQEGDGIIERPSILILNNAAWEIFEYSENKRNLRKALHWVDLALKMSSKPIPDVMDTKANILYKLGNKEKGLAIEQQVCQLVPKDKEKQECYSKMQGGISTWEN